MDRKNISSHSSESGTIKLRPIDNHSPKTVKEKAKPLEMMKEKMPTWSGRVIGGMALVMAPRIGFWPALGLGLVLFFVVEGILSIFYNDK